MSIEKLVHFFKYKDLNGSEISKLTGKNPILYPQLAKYKSLDELLGDEGFIVMLLGVTSNQNGHWVSFTKGNYPGAKYRFNDPYGNSPLTIIQEYVPFDEKTYPNYLERLFKGVDFEYNKTDYQSIQKETSTCGRYAGIFCNLRNLTLTQIQTVFKSNANAWLQDTDNVVTLMTLLQLNDIQDYLDQYKVR